MDATFFGTGLNGLGPQDALFFGTGLNGIGPPDLRPNPPHFTTTAARMSVVKCLGNSKHSFSCRFRSLLFSGGPTKQSPNTKGVALDDDGVVLVDDDVGGSLVNMDECEEQNGNWFLKILHVTSLWSSSNHNNNNVGVVDQGQNGNFTSHRHNDNSNSDNDDDDGVEECGERCSVSDDDDNEGQNGKVEFNREIFTKMLRKVPLGEAKLYARFSYLGSLAYSIPNIKNCRGNLWQDCVHLTLAGPYLWDVLDMLLLLLHLELVILGV